MLGLIKVCLEPLIPKYKKPLYSAAANVVWTGVKTSYVPSGYAKCGSMGNMTDLEVTLKPKTGKALTVKTRFPRRSVSWRTAHTGGCRGLPGPTQKLPIGSILRKVSTMPSKTPRESVFLVVASLLVLTTAGFNRAALAAPPRWKRVPACDFLCSRYGPDWTRARRVRPKTTSRWWGKSSAARAARCTGCASTATSAAIRQTPRSTTSR